MVDATETRDAGNARTAGDARTAGGARAAVTLRFGEAPEAAGLDAATLDRLAPILSRGSCRSFEETRVPLPVLRALCAAALSAPSKSDLQQRDVVILHDPGVVGEVKRLLSAQGWIAGAPSLLVFCANNRRQRLLHERWGRPFVNDHLDAFFNASLDAGIALSACVLAAEAAGLGCCPVSTIRNHADAVGDLLGLPSHVFPVAALAVGRPASGSRSVSPRLPLSVTVHVDRHDEAGLGAALDAYDRRHATPGAGARQRQVERFGHAETYAWSDDKTRQYASPERAEFGRHVRAKGFDLS